MQESQAQNRFIQGGKSNSTSSAVTSKPRGMRSSLAPAHWLASLSFHFVSCSPLPLSRFGTSRWPRNCPGGPPHPTSHSNSTFHLLDRSQSCPPQPEPSIAFSHPPSSAGRGTSIIVIAARRACQKLVCQFHAPCRHFPALPRARENSGHCTSSTLHRSLHHHVGYVKSM